MHSATLDNPPISYSFGPLYLARFILYLLVRVWVLDASLRIGLFPNRYFGMPKARLLQPKPVLYIGLSFTGIARVRLSVMISVKYDVISRGAAGGDIYIYIQGYVKIWRFPMPSQQKRYTYLFIPVYISGRLARRPFSMLWHLHLCSIMYVCTSMSGMRMRSVSAAACVPLFGCSGARLMLRRMRTLN